MNRNTQHKHSKVVAAERRRDGSAVRWPLGAATGGALETEWDNGEGGCMALEHYMVLYEIAWIVIRQAAEQGKAKRTRTSVTGFIG